jgi:hypothetical protein
MHIAKHIPKEDEIIIGLKEFTKIAKDKTGRDRK